MRKARLGPPPIPLPRHIPEDPQRGFLWQPARVHFDPLVEHDFAVPLQPAPGGAPERQDLRRPPRVPRDIPPVPLELPPEYDDLFPDLGPRTPPRRVHIDHAGDRHRGWSMSPGLPY